MCRKLNTNKIKNEEKNEMKRLVTRSDIDGLACAMILRELGIVDEVKFAHPKDVQDGLVALTENDITTNLPYDSRVHLAFDHHESELKRVSINKARNNLVIDAFAKSAARVVYNYYGGAEKIKLSSEFLNIVDKCDGGEFTKDEILYPTGYVLLNFITDPRTGLGRYKNFSISNYQLMLKLIDMIPKYGIADILSSPDVAERVSYYFRNVDTFKEKILEIAKAEKKVVVIDWRKHQDVYVGNRFLVYAMFPNAEVSIYVSPSKIEGRTSIMIGKSIISPYSEVNIGDLCLRYGGGGHANAGTCQIDDETIDKELVEIIDYINS